MSQARNNSSVKLRETGGQQAEPCRASRGAWAPGGAAIGLHDMGSVGLAELMVGWQVEGEWLLVDEAAQHADDRRPALNAM